MKCLSTVQDRSVKISYLYDLISSTEITNSHVKCEYTQLYV